MIVFVVLGVFLVVGLLAGLVQRRAKALRSDPNFAATDHVEVQRGHRGLGLSTYPSETHHSEDAPEYEEGD